LHVDDEMLSWISTADYGSGADQHLVALQQVRDTGAFPISMHWYPGEVLELIRWSEPEDPEWKPGRTGEYGHWMRAFSCAALLRATKAPYGYGDGLGTDSTVVQLTLSLGALSVDFTGDAMKFLAWLLLQCDLEGSEEQVCPYAVGLLWFALHVPSTPDEAVIELADWATRRADELFQRPPGGNRGLREMVVTCQKSTSWETLAWKLLTLDLALRSVELQVRVSELSEEMLTSGTR
jgi:hypothetical protein